MHTITSVLDNLDRFDDVLVAWARVGVSSIPIVERSGFHRRRASVPGAHFVGVLPALLDEVENSNYTLFSAVTGEEQVAACNAATEQTVGELSEPYTGVFAAWPLDWSKGREKRQLTGSEGA